MDKWKKYFKPEVAHSGQRLVDSGKILLPRPSDTELICYVNAVGTRFKVKLSSPSVGDSCVESSCTCSVAGKGVPCKHIWAVMSLVEQGDSDFLIEKTEMVLMDSEVVKPKSEYGERQQQFKQNLKERQVEQRQRQSQWQKDWRQKQKEARKAHSTKNFNKQSINSDLPHEVQVALSYFSENGFELQENLTLENIALAKKKLARIFHPDRGGSHNEIVQLHEQVEVLVHHLKT